MKNTFIFLQIIFGFTLFFSINAFATDTTQNIISFKRLSMEDGLSSKQVNCGFQDSKGYIWFGTNNGLQRYDGKNFKNFTKEKNQLQDNVVSRIFEDDQNQLWIMYGLQRGLAIPIPGKVDLLDLKTNKITSFAEKFKNTFPFNTNDVGAIYINERKDLLFLINSSNSLENLGNYNNGYLYSATKGIKSIPFNFLVNYDIIFSGDYIISNNSDKNYIINTTNNSIHNFNAQKGISPIFAKDGNLYYVEQGFKKRKNIYVNSLSDFFNKTIPPPNLFLSNAVNYNQDIITFTQQNNALVYIDQKKLHIYDSESHYKILDNAAWENEVKLTVFSFFNTKDGKKWICTSNGVYKISVEKNNFMHLLSSDVYPLKLSTNYQARNIFISPTKDIFISSWGGLFKIKEQAKYKYSYKQIPNFNASNNYTNGAFYDGGIIYRKSENWVQNYNTVTDKVINYTAPVKDIWTGIKTKQNNFLVATLSSLQLWNNTTLDSLKNCEGNTVPPMWIQQFYNTRDGLLWAVGNKGLFTISNNNCVDGHYHTKASEIKYKLPVENFNAMHEDKEGIIWIATNSEGLLKWNRGLNSFEQFTTEKGFCSNTLYGILEDEKEYLWISSDNGLMRFNKQNNQLKIYKTVNGLTNNEFNRCCFAKAPDGQMFFGGINGVNSFYPKDFWSDTLTYNAPLEIVSFNKFNYKINSLEDKTDDFINTNTILLNPGDNLFTLVFQLQDYSSSKQKFAYRIVGIDKDWLYTSENNIRFSGLPYGNYVIEIKGQNEEGLWSKNQISIPLKIIAPVTSKFWFRALIFLLLLGSVFLFFRYRTFQLLKAQKNLEKIVSERTIELNNSLLQKEVLLKEIHHRVKNNLYVISSLLNLQSSNIDNEQAKIALQESQNRVRSIGLIHQHLYQHENLAAIEIKSFITEMYNEIEALFYNGIHKVEKQFNIDPILLNIDTAVPLGLIINELCTNSFKYAFDDNTKNGIIKITFFKKDNETYNIIYEDNGPGIPDNFNFEKSTSLGFKIIKILSKQLGGEARYSKLQYPTFTISFKDNIK